MCGIAGVVNYQSGQPVNRGLAADMLDIIRHRGPDDEGTYFCDEGGAYLGHRRLSIIDLTTGHQPMTNEDGTVWTVFNDEIYNFSDLRKELLARGHKFETTSDTETILHGYEEWGLDVLPRLNGMFGLALWDERKRSLVLPRDPYGVKPVYYWDSGKTLVFGSEIKPLLLHPEIERKINPSSLTTFLSWTYVPSPMTVFEGIFKIPPGHALVCQKGATRLVRFYKSNPEPLEQRSEKAIVSELQDRIDAAVSRQMIADVPVGAMLSGGVDSSTVASLMTKHANRSIKTFTVGFEGDFEGNELEPAREMAASLDCDHHDVVVSMSEFYDFLPHSIWHLEEPIATASTLPYYMVCKLASEHVKVVLTGQGADEPFAGYPRHRGERFGMLYRVLPRWLRNGVIAPLVERLPRNEQAKRAVRALAISDPVDRFTHVYDTTDDKLRRRLLFDGAPCLPPALHDTIRLWQSDVVNWDGVAQMLYVDARMPLADNLLMYGDKMAMAVSLEARVPFLDLELMDYVERLPSKLKLGFGRQKHVLKEAVSKWIPAEVINRPKLGFATPLDRWFQGDLRHIIEERLLGTGSGCSQYFQLDTVRQMLDDHFHRRQDYKRPLFSLLTFEVWHELFITPARWEVPQRS